MISAGLHSPRQRNPEYDLLRGTSEIRLRPRSFQVLRYLACHALGEFPRQFATVTRGMAIQSLEEARNPCSPECVRLPLDESLPLDDVRHR